MKNIIIVIACLLLAAACRKKEATVQDKYAEYNGTINAIRNGKEWKPKLVVVSNSRNDSIGLTIADIRDDFLWDQIGIGPVPLIAGTYNLIDENTRKSAMSIDSLRIPAASYNGSFNEGSDVGGRNFIRTDRPRRITIDYYNPTTREVKGSFEVAFMRSDTSRSRQLGLLDTVTYTNATFSAIIWRQEDLPQ